MAQHVPDWKTRHVVWLGDHNNVPVPSLDQLPSPTEGGPVPPHPQGAAAFADAAADLGVRDAFRHLRGARVAQASAGGEEAADPAPERGDAQAAADVGADAERADPGGDERPLALPYSCNSRDYPARPVMRGAFETDASRRGA